MPGYTNPWSDVIPAGATQARLIDDHIRQVRLDISQRMAEIIVNWSADPIVLKPELLGGVTGKLLVIPWLIAAVDTSTAYDINTDGQNIQVTDRVYMPLLLPPGITVTKIELLGDKRGNASFTWSFGRRSFVAGVQVTTTISSVVHATANIAITDTGVIAEVINGANMYWILSAASASARDLYAVRITYNTPDSKNTI